MRIASTILIIASIASVVWAAPIVRVDLI